MSRPRCPETLTWDEAAPLVIRGVTANNSEMQAHLTRTTKRPTDGVCAAILETRTITEEQERILREAKLLYWKNGTQEFVRREE